MKPKIQPYPIIDLFAGPGGLGEGFASLMLTNNRSAFKSVVSIERDEFAHRTLTLRHFFRCFHSEKVPEEYYEYVAGWIEKDDLIKKYPVEWKEASLSSLMISLGKENHSFVKNIIRKRLGKTKKWALVGGPPCQAYSLVGRSRMMGTPEFENDERHFLYKEYLKIIADHRPPVFVMENVKGLLSSKVNGEPVIQKIVDDLSSPIKAIGKKKNGLRYRLYSLNSEEMHSNDVDPKEFLVRAEEYGVPQARHRMFIVGIRDDINVRPATLSKSESPVVEDVIGGLPKIRSGISKGADSAERWRDLVGGASDSTWYAQLERAGESRLLSSLDIIAARISSAPKRTIAETYKSPKNMSKNLSNWYYDERLKSLASHESRSHMPSDLHRYLFAAVYSKVHGVSPKLKNYPIALLPKHKSAKRTQKISAFEDRFRVQLPKRVATTITSHISKDGHYFIHYDPLQCRSLTVREAARLQTFPDSYHFEGPRTSQYHQIGNAVPPILASQIAQLIKDVLDEIPDD